jgi:hypothetical protein
MNATNINYKHEYNPVGPTAYFITFHTYGTWLHGDERGSTDHSLTVVARFEVKL